MRDSQSAMHQVKMAVYAPVPVHRELKVLAAKRGIPLSQLVMSLATKELAKARKAGEL